MPASETREVRRAGWLLTALFWTGVGLAPLAALLLLLGGSGSLLRIAVVVAILAVVLIGLSIALRRDSGSMRAEIEDVLYDEIDDLRDGVRGDIANAARATHKAFGERLSALQQTIEDLRGQLEAMRAHVDRLAVAPAAAAGSGHHQSRHVGGPQHQGGVVRHTETVVTTRQTMLVDPDEAMSRGHVYGHRDGRAPEQYDDQPRHVAWTPPAPRRPDPSEESWTDKLLRERFAGRVTLEPGGHRETYDDRTPERRPALPDRSHNDDDLISGLHAGDRWASVRSDDRGHEFRVGERRAAMHSDQTGTELRIEDRWAAVRREESARWDRGSADHHENWDSAGEYWRAERAQLPRRSRHSVDDEDEPAWNGTDGPERGHPGYPRLVDVEAGDRWR
jgi:hypothetical protein